MTVGHLSLQVLSTSLCVVIVTCSLFLQCVTLFLSREGERERAERELKPTLCAAQLREGQSRTYNAHGEMKPTGGRDDPIRIGRRDTMLSRYMTHSGHNSEDTHRHTPIGLVRVFPGTNTLDSEGNEANLDRRF